MQLIHLDLNWTINPVMCTNASYWLIEATFIFRNQWKILCQMLHWLCDQPPADLMVLGKLKPELFVED